LILQERFGECAPGNLPLGRRVRRLSSRLFGE
jgi:hypothetical protein